MVFSKYSFVVFLFLFFGLNNSLYAVTEIHTISSQGTNKIESDSSLYGVPSDFLDDLKERTFTYFWEVVDTETWQTDDRYPSRSFASVAATGFALPAYIVGVHNEYITREQGAERVHNVLDWLWDSPQGADPEGMTGHRGFFYHFLNYETGTRYQQVELSTIDTALLMAGILTAQSYEIWKIRKS